MKKHATIIVSFFAFCQMASAQITITAASGYAPGDFYTIQPCNPKLSELSKMGPDIDIDYSDVTTLGASQSFLFVAPASTPNASLFPTATVVSVLQPNTYTYYTSNSSHLNMLGTTTSQYNKVYQNPSTMLTFPTKYGDKINDAFAYEYTRNGVKTKRSGTSVQTADAYGNITTPTGTFPYLRIEILEEIIDSIFHGTEFYQTMSLATFSYIYMNSNHKAPLFSYYEVFNNDTEDDETTVFYNVSPPTAIEEKNILISKECIYPNPTFKDEITLSFRIQKDETISIQMMDINGKVVRSKSTNQLAAGDHQIPLNIASLASGCYAVFITSEVSGTKAVKFAKQ